MNLNPTGRFSNRADYYARFRPGYPPGVVKILSKELAFTRNDIVADIGSGTGLLTKLFLKNGNKVFAVEPNDKMRLHVEKDSSRFRNLVTVKATAEATTLAAYSVDLIAVGQALHWFNPSKTRREFSRISKPGAGLCVVYNKRAKSSGLSRGYAKVVTRYSRDRKKIPPVTDRLASAYFDKGEFSKFDLPNEQILSFRGLLGRLISASYVPTPKDKDFRAFEEDVREVFDSYSVKGRVRLAYDTEILVGKVSQPQ
jgi:SAM-dependent methyltransferase